MRASQGKMESGKAEKKCECPSMACTAEEHPCICHKDASFCRASRHECIHREIPIPLKCRAKWHYCICFNMVDTFYCPAETHDCVCMSNVGNCNAKIHDEYKPEGYTKRAISYKKMKNIIY
jgi:hypothetical protein